MNCSKCGQPIKKGEKYSAIRVCRNFKARVGSASADFQHKVCPEKKK